MVLPMVKFGQPKSDRLGHIDTVDSDLMHHQFRLSLLQWNPGPTRRNPTNIVSAACGKFHAVILQEASDHVPHISDQFRVYTDNMDLAILLNKDTFEPDPIVLTFKADSTSKGTWNMVLLIVRGLLRRPSLSGSPAVTFCSVHIHDVVAEKRDASTELLQFVHAKMREHNGDFIGGDFNMSAFSTVSDVFSDSEFSAPGHSCLWGLGALDEQHRECTGFLIMPKLPDEWRVDSHGCYKFDNAALGLGPRDQSAHFPVFLHLRNTNLPDPAVSCAVSKHNKEGLSANITNSSVRGDDVLDCDVAHHSHVSAHLFLSLPFTCESLGASCFASHRRSDVLIEVSVSVSVSDWPTAARQSWHLTLVETQSVAASTQRFSRKRSARL